jgi:hypothetical protein
MVARRTRSSFAALKRKLLSWPGVEESTSYGAPSLKAFGKFLTRLKEDGDSIVLTGINFDEREMLMETQADVFYITDHYRNFPSVLMRLSASDAAAAEAMLRRRWRELAPKKIRAEFDQARPANHAKRVRAPALAKRGKST